MLCVLVAYVLFDGQAILVSVSSGRMLLEHYRC